GEEDEEEAAYDDADADDGVGNTLRPCTGKPTGRAQSVAEGPGFSPSAIPASLTLMLVTASISSAMSESGGIPHAGKPVLPKASSAGMCSIRSSPLRHAADAVLPASDEAAFPVMAD
ncbi:unnamed protein product, partial [Prorocentrum cordatum]